MTGIEEHGHISIAVGMVVIVRGPGTCSGVVPVRSRQQTADAAGALHCAAEIDAARVNDRGHVIGIAFLDDTIAIIDVLGDGEQDPITTCTSAPGVRVAADALWPFLTRAFPIIFEAFAQPAWLSPRAAQTTSSK